jgi:hypothetical protein
VCVFVCVYVNMYIIAIPKEKNKKMIGRIADKPR